MANGFTNNGLSHKQRYKACVAKRKALQKARAIPKEGFFGRRKECLKREINTSVATAEANLARTIQSYRPFRQKDNY